MQRAAAGTAAVSALGLTLAIGPSTGASAAPLGRVFTDSQILVGLGQPPTLAQTTTAQVAADRTTTVSIQVTDINDTAATAGRVEITVDLSNAGSVVDVVDLHTTCNPPATNTVVCTLQLPDVSPPVP